MSNTLAENVAVFFVVVIAFPLAAIVIRQGWGVGGSLGFVLVLGIMLYLAGKLDGH